MSANELNDGRVVEVVSFGEWFSFAEVAFVGCGWGEGFLSFVSDRCISPLGELSTLRLRLSFALMRTWFNVLRLVLRERDGMGGLDSGSCIW